MPTINQSFSFQEGFNAVWNVIENCRFIPAPYDTEINTGRLYVAKRMGTQLYNELPYDIIGLGKYLDTDKEEKLAITTNNFLKFTDETETVISALSEEDSVVSKIKSIPGGGQSVGGTATSGGPFILVDTSKDWTINEWAGYYVWIKTGKGIGDVQLIASNTSDTLTVSGWTGAVEPDSTSTYGIFPYLSNETVMVSNDTEVKFYDGSVLQNAGVSQFDKAIEYDNRVFYIDNQKKSLLYYSYVGQSLAIESFIDTGFGDIIDIIAFGEYLIIGKTDKIQVLKKDKISETETFYSLVNVISDKGVMAKGSMGNFNNGLFFLGNDTDLYGVSIEVQSDNSVSANYISQGKTLRGYLNNMTPFDYYQFFTYNGDLYFIKSDENETIEFVYNTDNKGWLVNKYSFQIKNNIVYNGVLFKTFENNVVYRGGKKDLDVNFEQKVGVMFGIEDQYHLKKIHFIKYAIGAIKDSYLAVKYNAYLSFTRFGSSYKDFGITGLLNSLLGNEDMFGGFMFGDNMFGGGINAEYPQVVFIKDNLSNSAEAHIHQILLSDKAESEVGFVFGGLFIEYLQDMPQKEIPILVMKG